MNFDDYKQINAINATVPEYTVRAGARRAVDMAAEHDDDLYTIVCPLCRHKSQAKYEDVSGHQCQACGFVNGEYWNAAEVERNG